MRGGMFMLRIMSCNSDSHEDEGEYGEDKRLDEPHEDLEEEERQRDDVRHEERHDRKEHFARENVAEKAERERHHLSKLRHEFKDSHEKVDRPLEVEELARVGPEAEGEDAEKIDGHDREKSEREGEVEVGRG